MTVSSYHSTDTSAPVLTGEAGSLIALLEQCLVLGYGSKAGAGWTKEFDESNVAAFRNGVADGGLGLYLQVADDGLGPGGYKSAVITGYEAMSDATTGTGPFPNVSGGQDPVYWPKSHTEDSTPRPWELFADELLFYLFINHRHQYAGIRAAQMFGDIVTAKSGDGYHCALIGCTAAAPSYPGIGQTFADLGSDFTKTQDAHFMARGYSQIGGSIPFGKIGDRTASTDLGGGGMLYPSPVDNGLWLSPLHAVESPGVIRGKFPGLWQPLHEAPLTVGDQIADVTGLEGRTLEAVSFAYNSAIDGRGFIDLTGPWRS